MYVMVYEMTKPKVKYNINLLKVISERDHCKIDFNAYQGTLNRDVSIEYVCKCGTNGNKIFRVIYEIGGAFCLQCTKEKKKTKTKRTCIDKYGVENPMQTVEVRDKFKQTCIEKYGVEHALQSVEMKDKFKQTCLDRYGVEYPMQSVEVRDKSKQTCIEKYGVENPMQTVEVRDKFKQTCIEKYGVEHALQSVKVKDKMKQTFIAKYGVENPFQSAEVKDKMKKTCLHKYGVEYPMQSADIFDKSVMNKYKQKIFTFPCGETRYVQGYEQFALQVLIENGYLAEEIITERRNVPKIFYEYNNNQCRYFPDIYIPVENKIIEVKSQWTYDLHKERNKLKAEACKQAGYSFEFWIFDDKGNKLEYNNTCSDENC